MRVIFMHALKFMFLFFQLMRHWQMNPEGENMISSGALHISPRRIKEHADKVTTNPFMI